MLATFSEEQVDFTKLDSNKKDIVLRNHSTKPYYFKMKKMAHMCISPDQGFLPSGQEMVITLSFQPHQVGRFDVNLECAIFGDIKASSISVSDQILMNLELKIIAELTIEGELFNKEYSQVIVKPTATKLPEISPRPSQMVENSYQMKMFNEWMSKASHRDLYVDYIRKSRVERLLQKHDEKYGDFAEFCERKKIQLVDPLNGLVPPQPLKPTVKSKFALVKNDISNNHLENLSSIENSLTAEDLDRIFLSTPEINFGPISTHDTKRITINFSNRILSCHAPVQISLAPAEPDKGISIFPSSIVVPLNQTVEVEISCCAHVPGELATKITYVVNNRYIYHVPLNANIVFLPPRLKTNQVKFDVAPQLDELSADFVAQGSQQDLSGKEAYLTEYVQNVEYKFPLYEKVVDLINDGGSNFSFEVVQNLSESPTKLLLEYGACDGQFFVSPKSGHISANKSTPLTIRYIPGTKVMFEENIEIVIFDAFDGVKTEISRLHLNCVGEGPQASVNLVNSNQKSAVDLGLVPIISKPDDSLAKRLYEPSLTNFAQSFTGKTPLVGEAQVRVRNSGSSPVHYIARLASGNAVMKLLNPYGILPGNSVIDIGLRSWPLQEGVFEDFLIINFIASGKSFKIPVRLEAKVPSVEIEPTGLSFSKEVIIGCSSCQDYVIKNTGQVFARLVVDFGKYPDFRVDQLRLISSINQKPSSASRSRVNGGNTAVELADRITTLQLPDSDGTIALI